MKKLIAGLLLNAIIPITTLAQKITLVKATEQHWSGGVVGNHGVNYLVVLKCTGKKMSFDSIYVNNIGYAVAHKANGGNLYMDSVNHTYSISVGEAHMGRPHTMNPKIYPQQDSAENQAKATEVAPVRHFEGKALVVYHYKGKKRFFIVNEFALLKQLNYP